MKRVATIVLNRNLPDVTDRLCDHLLKHDADITDIFVVDAGSDVKGRARSTTWIADWPDAVEHGLRYSRGMNYGLSQLVKQDKFAMYDAFFLLTNDTEFDERPTLAPLMAVMDKHPRIGILSPCSERWGERQLLQDEKTKYFWFIHNNAYLLRRAMVETIANFDEPDFMNFLFDGTNFRGYMFESEIIAKGYVNDWAAAITSEVWARENEAHLLNKAALIKTEPYEANLKLYLEEGQRWMHKKYGFRSRWSMQRYVKSFYDDFFEFHPEYEAYKL